MGRAEEIAGLSPTIQTIIAEAAGEGYEGMKKVVAVMHSRSQLPRWKGKKTDDIVQEAKQFSGWERPDRVAFLMKQPAETFNQAGRALKDAEKETKGKPGADHYLTKKLYGSDKAPGW